MESIIKNFRAEIKSVDVEAKTVTAIVSHAKKDRDGDIIPPDAFKKRLKRYKEHPVLLVNHSYDVGSQIGEAKDIKLNDDHVEATFEYYVGKGNPNADWAFELAKAGMAGYSIGFQSFGFDWIEEKDEQGNKRTTGRKFTDIELLEISHVVIPSNPNALQLMVDSSESSVEEKELCGLVLKGIADGTIKPVDEPLTITGNKMADEEINKVIADMKNSISQFQQQITEMASRVLMLEQKVTTLENVDKVGDTGVSGQPEGGKEDGDKHYSDLILNGETKGSGEGSDKTKPAPDEAKVDVVSVVKEALKNAVKGGKT